MLNVDFLALFCVFVRNFFKFMYNNSDQMILRMMFIKPNVGISSHICVLMCIRPNKIIYMKLNASICNLMLIFNSILIFSSISKMMLIMLCMVTNQRIFATMLLSPKLDYEDCPFHLANVNMSCLILSWPNVILFKFVFNLILCLRCYLVSSSFYLVLVNPPFIYGSKFMFFQPNVLCTMLLNPLLFNSLESTSWK